MSQVALNVLIGARDRATPVYRKIGSTITRSILAPLRSIRRLTSSIGSNRGGLTGFFAGLFSVQAAGNFLKQLVEIEKTTEKIIQINQTAAGSGILSAENLEAITEISNRLGLVTLDAAESFGKFATAGRLSGLTNKENITIFEDVSVAIAGMRLSADDANGVFKALQQIMSKGKVQAEELRGQLGERLPGAFALFAKSMGVSEQQLSKMLEKGEVLAKDTLPKFTAELRKAFSGAATEGAEGLNASLNRLTNSFQGFLKAINRDTPFLKALNEVINKLTDFLTGDVARGITAALTPIFSFIQRNAGPIIALLAGGAGTVAAGGIGALITTVVSSLGAVAAPLGILVAGIGALATSFVLLRNTAVQVGDVIAPLKDIVGEQFEQIVENISKAFGSSSVTSEFKDTIASLVVEVGNILVVMSSWVKDVLPKFIAGFQKAEVFTLNFIKGLSGDNDSTLVGALKAMILPIQALIVAAASAALLVLKLAQGISILIETFVAGISTIAAILDTLDSKGVISKIAKLLSPATATSAVTDIARDSDGRRETSRERVRAAIKPFSEAAKALGSAAQSTNDFIAKVIMLQGGLDNLGKAMSAVNIDGSARAAEAARELLKSATRGSLDLLTQARIGRSDSPINVAELKSSLRTALTLALRSGEDGLASDAQEGLKRVATALKLFAENREFNAGERIIRSLDKDDKVTTAVQGLRELIAGRTSALRNGDTTAFKQFDKAIEESVANLTEFRKSTLESAKATSESQRKRIATRVAPLRGGERLLEGLKAQATSVASAAVSSARAAITGLRADQAGGAGVDNNFNRSATFGLAEATQRAAELREKQVEIAQKQHRKTVEDQLKTQTDILKKGLALQEAAAGTTGITPIKVLGN